MHNALPPMDKQRQCHRVLAHSCCLSHPKPRPTFPGLKECTGIHHYYFWLVLAHLCSRQRPQVYFPWRSSIIIYSSARIAPDELKPCLIPAQIKALFDAFQIFLPCGGATHPNANPLRKWDHYQYNRPDSTEQQDFYGRAQEAGRGNKAMIEATIEAPRFLVA